ncbi:PilT protein domain protein [Spirochaeta thermophila DSM 6578]|uniref:PilT protein domain protein n=1 Tax=Winmispira thermophila (strain ATCC 700085 / DSM 6578 / Z-1203) TaxID=869211 RepID=G0GFL0_WINT7|nr:type II toxin-antitoxin system VapC family toxin [Spirochaeta thermophila]AEJ62409.1 PilT protein domain protein [Spirochaeta thermophila DSM 6578]
MNILIDTQAFLWAVSDSDKLSERAKEVFYNPQNVLYFSAASYWEICLKMSLGKLRLEKGWKKVIDREMSVNSIKWLKLKKEHMVRLLYIPWLHNDPFDRMLIAQAQMEKCAILTSDPQIAQYDVQTIW